MKLSRYLTKDAVWLYSLFAVNGIFPLAVIPILTRAIGIEGYGILAYHQAVVVIFMAFIDFAFNLTATREIAKKHSLKLDISADFSKYMSAKIILMIIVLSAYLSFFSFSSSNKLVALCFVPQLVGTVLFPIWYFQGVQLFRQLAISHITAKIAVFVLILVLVDTASDLYWGAALVGATYIFSGVISLAFIVKSRKILFSFAPIAGIRAIAESKDMFIGVFANALYANIGVVMLGSFGDDVASGLFAIGMKLRNGFQQVVQPINQILFPKVSALSSSGNEKKLLVTRIFRYQSSGIACFTALGLLLSGIIADVFISNSDNQFRQLVAICLVGAGLNAMKLTILLFKYSAYGFDKRFRNTVIVANSICVGVLLFLGFYVLEGRLLLFALTYLVVDFATLIWCLFVSQNSAHDKI